MLIRPLARLVARIPSASAVRLLAFDKYRSLHVVRPVLRAKAQLHTAPEKTENQINRERLYEKIFDSDGKIQLHFTPKEGYSIFTAYRSYIFLDPEQAKVVIDNIDKPVEATNKMIFEDMTIGLRIRKTEEGVIKIDKKLKIWDGVRIPPEAVPSAKKNLAAVLEKYEELKAKGKLRSQ